MLIFDAHLDLSMNALLWNRDLTRPVSEIRAREAGQTDKPDRAKGTVSLPEMRRGQVGLCVGTLIGRYVTQDNPLPGYHSPQIAWAMTQGQLAWYQAMETLGELVQIRDLASLEKHLKLWSEEVPADAPIGYILSLEGADSIWEVSRLELAYKQGLRAIGPAHYGPGLYAQGTDASGGLGQAGRDLLQEMQRLNIILDVTHLCDDSFWEALDLFHGPIWASHSNCRELVPHNRQFSDEQIRELVCNRGAVIGAAFDAWMLIPNWERGSSTPEETGVSISHVIDHIDHICQIAGNARHVGIGTDLDGGYGREQSPADLDTIADLREIPEMLAQRGYSPEDIEGIMYGNWVRFLRKAWG